MLGPQAVFRLSKWAKEGCRETGVAEPAAKRGSRRNQAGNLRQGMAGGAGGIAAFWLGASAGRILLAMEDWGRGGGGRGW